MGILIVDHTNCVGPDGKAGRKLEFDTISCKHCQAIIKVIIRGVEKAAETKYRCTRCHGPICKHCAEVLQGACSPLMAKVEQAIKTGVWPDGRVPYEYKIIPAS